MIDFDWIHNNMNTSSSLLRKFMDNWLDSQDEAVRENVGFFVFPHLVKIGGAMTLPMLFSENDDHFSQTEEEIRLMCTEIITKVGDFLCASSTDIEISSFSSTDEIDILFESIGEDLQHDFENFLQEEKILVHFDGLARKEKMERLAFYFTVGYATMLEAFHWIEGHLTDDDQELRTELEEYRQNSFPLLLSNVIKNCILRAME